MLQKDGSHKRRQVATQVNAGKVSIDQLAKEIADDTSLGKGDIKSVLIHLADLTMRYVTMGFSVDLGDLGTLTPRLSAESLPLGEKYTAQHIRKVNARFTPAPAFKERLRGTSFELCKEKESGKCPAPKAPEAPETPKEPKGDDSSETGSF